MLLLHTLPCTLSCAITFSSTPSTLTSHFRRLCAVPTRSPQRVLGLPPARICRLHGARRTSTRTRTSLPRHFFAQWRFIVSSPCALFTRNRCFHGFSLPPSSPVGEPAKLNPSHASAERNNLRSTAATLLKSKKWGYTEIASLLSRPTNVPPLDKVSSLTDV